MESLSELDSDHRPVVSKLGIDRATHKNPATNWKKFAKLINPDSPLTDLIPGIIDSVDVAKEAAGNFTTFIHQALTAARKRSQICLKGSLRSREAQGANSM